MAKGIRPCGGVTAAECRRMMEKAMENSKVKFLTAEMKKYGCSFNPNKFFKAIDCKGIKAGGFFIPGKGIRANVLSGDCHYLREFFRGNTHLRGQEPECVRRRATESVRANRHCSEYMTKIALDAVWETCYNDTEPFDKAP
ncbi:hypothetical protein C2S51_006489 [Perilla frutescens var. frutescens]|nr:hypothetical protein C2S51_006489 [Perilla frutescens var. frutescens]